MSVHPPGEPACIGVELDAGTAHVWWQLTAQRSLGQGRRLLQHAIAATYHRAEGDVVLVPDQCGRPTLAPGQGLPPLRLTASHSGSVTVVALAGFDIGIDIEELSALPAEPLLTHSLTAGERALLYGESVQVQLDVFCTLWTAKEAVAKALGWPLLRALVDVEVDTHPQLRVVRLGKDAAPRGWQLRPLGLRQTTASITLAARCQRRLKTDPVSSPDN